MVEKVANQYGNGSYEKVAEELNLSSESLGLKDGNMAMHGILVIIGVKE